MDDLAQPHLQLATDYFLSSASQFVTSTTGAVLSMMEFTDKNLTSLVTLIATGGDRMPHARMGRAPMHAAGSGTVTSEIVSAELDKVLASKLFKGLNG